MAILKRIEMRDMDKLSSMEVRNVSVANQSFLPRQHKKNKKAKLQKQRFHAEKRGENSKSSSKKDASSASAKAADKTVSTIYSSKNQVASFRYGSPGEKAATSK